MFAVPILRLVVPAAAVAVALLGAGCACCPTAGSPGTDAAVTHVVLVWLKDPGNADHRERVLEASRRFRSIAGVIGMQAGPSVASDREIVDDSFDVGMVIRFRDAGALRAYLAHPVHETAVREVLGPLAERVVVHDFTES